MSGAERAAWGAVAVVAAFAVVDWFAGRAVGGVIFGDVDDPHNDHWWIRVNTQAGKAVSS